MGGKLAELQEMRSELEADRCFYTIGNFDAPPAPMIKVVTTTIIT